MLRSLAASATILAMLAIAGCAKTPGFLPTAPESKNAAETFTAPLAAIPTVPGRPAKTAAPPVAITRRVAYAGQNTPVEVKPGEGVEVDGVPVGTKLEIEAWLSGGAAATSYLAWVKREDSAGVTLMVAGSQETWPVIATDPACCKQTWDIEKAVVGAKGTITVGLGIEKVGDAPSEGKVEFLIRTTGQPPENAVVVEPGYFSDFTEVRVTSKSAWDLYAEMGPSRRKIKSGQGSLTFAWGSRPLPDGDYGLKLESRSSGAFAAEATATIDTMPPSLTDFRIFASAERAIEYSATVREPADGSGVDPESVRLVVNGKTIDGGSDSFDLGTGKYAKTLEIADAPKFAVPRKETGNRLSIVAVDLAGNLGQTYIDADLGSSGLRMALKEFPDSAGYGLASVPDRRIAAARQQYDGVYYPLMGDILNLHIARLPSTGPAVAVISRAGLPLAVFRMVACSDGTCLEADWNFRNLLGRFVPSGDYVARVLEFGLIDPSNLRLHIPTLVKVNTDLAPFDWQLTNQDRHVHICWGSKSGPPHHWESVFPGFPAIKPASPQPIATSLYLGKIQPLLRSLVNPEGGVLTGGSRSTTVEVLYTFPWTSPETGIPAQVVLDTGRRIDASGRFVQESIDDSWALP